jgi:hypothetical protein
MLFVVNTKARGCTGTIQPPGGNRLVLNMNDDAAATLECLAVRHAKDSPTLTLFAPCARLIRHSALRLWSAASTMLDVESMPPIIRDTYESYRLTFGEHAVFSWDGRTLSYTLDAAVTVCDFCNEKEGPYSIWPAEDIVVCEERRGEDIVGHRSVGAWFACLPCTPLVGAGNRDAVLKRAVAAIHAREGGDWHPIFTLAVRAAHDAYWSARVPCP